MTFKSNFILLRHGEPTPFLGPWIQPHENTLSKNGVDRASEVSILLESKEIEVIYSSPFARALQTAEIIGKNLALETKVEENLKERAQGDLENRKLSEEAVNKLWEKFKVFKSLSFEEQWVKRPFSGFETDKELLERSLHCLNKIDQVSSGKKLLIVTHASLIKVLLIHFGKIKLLDRDNVKIKVVEYFEV